MSSIAMICHPQFGQIRTSTHKREPIFCALDICKALGFASTTDVMLRKLDDDEKLTRKVYGSGQNREMYFVTESGLYNLIFRSYKPEAKAFRKWVTSEVLPAIRKHGYYTSPHLRYEPNDNQQLGNDYMALAYRELLKIQSSRVRNRLASLMEYYVSKIR